MDPKLVKSYLYQINEAILFCHQRRVLHRDLKPQNLPYLQMVLLRLLILVWGELLGPSEGDSEIDQRFRIFRVLKTPNEELWPGVSSLPDYKATFPHWTNYNLASQIKNLDEEGLNLLKDMLIYDPAKRISAKRIATHPYFKDVDLTVKPIIPEKKDKN
ncbi:hypothetical protein JTB14_024734 [Gonioctena quinquepunctata]|nr:hypothetical protein JTB14_024734 [Gonioctena quinquepunctata]